MSKNSIKEIQNELLIMVKDFHEFCIKYNLKYYIIGGTLLGAVRHQGFIPWDDDIDIGMPRDSYDKFVNEYSKYLPKYLECLNAPYGNLKKDYLFIKLCNANTTLIEYDIIDRVEGLFIDIFPLDGAGNNLLTKKIKYYIIKVFIILLSLNASK